MGIWSENRLYFRVISGKSSTSCKNVSTGILASDKGGGIYVEEGSHPKNICEKRSILEQPVLSRKKGCGEQTCDKLKESECIHYLSSLQNGRLAFAEGHAERENIGRTSGFVGKSVIRIPVCMFWPGTSSTNFYKATEYPNSNSTKNQHSRIIVYLDDMLLISQTIEGLNMARDTLIFLIQQLGFIINLKKSVLSTTKKLEFLGLEIDSVNMTLTLPMGKVKSLTQKCRNLMENSKPTLWEITNLIGSLCSTPQTVIMPAFLQIGYL